MIKRIILATLLLLILMWHGAPSQSPVQRFPRPQFETGHQLPPTTTPPARSVNLDILDVLMLLAALSLASYFSIYKRSRLPLFLLMIGSLLYFGFWRKGCICPVGSIQNVLLAFIDPSYIVPWTVVLFFALPLAFSLFFGRAFCAAVCPLGALQDLFALRPVQTPAWLEKTLRIIPYAWFGLVVLLVTTKSAFLICRFDPFIGIFRMQAGFNMVLFGLLFSGLGIFIARPYCRFLCPYGLILSWTSRLSRRNITISPQECVQCRLCEHSCPFGAINPPQSAAAPQPLEKRTRRLAWMLCLLPVELVVGAALGSQLHIPLSRIHPTVQLAETIYQQDAGMLHSETLESKAFRGSGKSTEELYQEARLIQENFKTGSRWFGAFLLLIIHLKLIAYARTPRQKEYVADRGRCLSCGRCFADCPVEMDRRLKRLSLPNLEKEKRKLRDQV